MCRPLGEWWKNHIITQSDEEHVNVALLDGTSLICKAIQCVDASKWEQAMQEEYKSLIANSTSELTPLPYNRHDIGCRWVFREREMQRGMWCFIRQS